MIGRRVNLYVLYVRYSVCVCVCVCVCLPPHPVTKNCQTVNTQDYKSQSTKHQASLNERPSVVMATQITISHLDRFAASCRALYPTVTVRDPQWASATKADIDSHSVRESRGRPSSVNVNSSVPTRLLSLAPFPFRVMPSMPSPTYINSSTYTTTNSCCLTIRYSSQDERDWTQQTPQFQLRPVNFSDDDSCFYFPIVTHLVLSCLVLSFLGLYLLNMNRINHLLFFCSFSFNEIKWSDIYIDR